MEQWVMTDLMGNNVYEFPDCMNLKLIFKGANKEQINIFDLESKKIGELDER
jgi:hypothetical protein